MSDQFSKHLCRPATSLEDFKIIEQLAKEILPGVYDPIVPSEQTLFFLQKYQTIEAIQAQVNKNYEYYLLFFENRIEGYLGLEFRDQVIRISKIYLKPSARGKGLGKWGMNWSEKRAIESGIPKLDLIVNRANNHSIKFYQNLGYQIVESLTNELKDGFHVLDYRLEKRLHG